MDIKEGSSCFTIIENLVNDLLTDQFALSINFLLFPLWCCQVSKYLHNTHAKTHSNYTVDIVQIFRASREGEVERYSKVRMIYKNV